MFIVYLGCLAVAVAATLLMPETIAARGRATLRIQRLFVPEEIRPTFFSAALSAFTAFALLGLFIALVPSFLGKELHQPNHAVAGAVVGLLFAIATVAQLMLHELPSRRALLLGFPWLLLGLGLLMLGLDIGDLAVFVAGTCCSGIGVGLVTMASVAMVNRVAPPEHRGEVISSFFIAAYAGLAIPALGVGIASQHFGFFRATLVCSIVLAALLGTVAVRVLGARAAPV